MLAFPSNFLEEKTIIAPFQETGIHQEKFAFHVFPGGHPWNYQVAAQGLSSSLFSMYVLLPAVTFFEAFFLIDLTRGKSN